MTDAFPAGSSVGLIAMSASPAHAGHFKLIEGAANENDYVIVYVSISDRKRKGQFPISGQIKQQIWKQHLEGIMPDNVTLEYGGSPVTKIYTQLGEENERYQAGDQDIASYVVYSDPDDLQANFPKAKLDKYLGDIWQAGLIRMQPITRESTVNVSGTHMRQLLQQGDKEAFMKLLPDPLSRDAREDIWSLLAKH